MGWTIWMVCKRIRAGHDGGYIREERLNFEQDGVCDRKESVLNRDPWCCPDPGISGTSLEGVGEAGGRGSDTRRDRHLPAKR